jgi:TRAP-type C4-dicarboxylate transport system permease small subunit
MLFLNVVCLTVTSSVPSFSEEGVRALFSGWTMASSRAVMVTIGQLSLYDQFKQMLLGSGKWLLWNQVV